MTMARYAKSKEKKSSAMGVKMRKSRESVSSARGSEIGRFPKGQHHGEEKIKDLHVRLNIPTFLYGKEETRGRLHQL